MFKVPSIKQWILKKRLCRAAALLGSVGLSVVKFREVAGTIYIEKQTGELLKLSRK
jgi:hypothetical protein